MTAKGLLCQAAFACETSRGGGHGFVLPSVRQERRRKGRESALGTAARSRGQVTPGVTWAYTFGLWRSMNLLGAERGVKPNFAYKS